MSLFLGVDTRRDPLLSGISPKNHSLGKGWRVVRAQSLPLETCDAIVATASVQEKGGRQAYVVSWEQGTDPLALETLRDVLALDRSPWQRPYDAAAVRISTPLARADAEDDARERIDPFVDLVLEEFPPPEGDGCR